MREKKLLFEKFGKVFPAGTILFEEGQPCEGMYIIQKGRVRLYKKAGGKKITIDLLEDEDFFGEMACLLNQPRSINAVVEEDSQILVVEPEVLEELFREKDGLGIKVLGNLASRLKKSYEVIRRLVEERDSLSGKESGSP
jgi:CRP/FNR family transcriptional regulator, cyclic AMP receptor protein